MKARFECPSDSNNCNLLITKSRIVLLLILFFILPACIPVVVDHPVKIVIGTPFELKVRDIASVSNNLSFAIDSVHDGRCPIGVYCIWAGDAYLYFDIKENYNHIDSMICMNSCHTNPFQLAGYTFKVLDVTPYPDFHKQTDPRDTKIKMVVTED